MVPTPIAGVEDEVSGVQVVFVPVAQDDRLGAEVVLTPRDATLDVAVDTSLKQRSSVWKHSALMNTRNRSVCHCRARLPFRVRLTFCQQQP